MGMILRAIVLCAVGAAIGLVLHLVRGDGLSVRGFAVPVQCTGELAADEPTEIAPGDAAGLCARTDVVVADTRPATRYAEGHVAGAIHLPCDADGRVASEAMARLDGARMIIVYGEGTDDAQPVAFSLRRRAHHPHVVVLRGGFAGWSRDGLACASGPCEECAEVSR
jgi:rhodanese-related sulfurtransferase